MEETNETKTNQTSSNKVKQVVKLILVIAALAIAYLYALNGRYTVCGQYGNLLDNWTGKWHNPYTTE